MKVRTIERREASIINILYFLASAFSLFPDTPLLLLSHTLIGPHKRIMLMMIGAIQAPDLERRGAFKAQLEWEPTYALQSMGSVGHRLQSTDFGVPMPIFSSDSF